MGKKMDLDGEKWQGGVYTAQFLNGKIKMRKTI